MHAIAFSILNYLLFIVLQQFISFILNLLIRDRVRHLHVLETYLDDFFGLRIDQGEPDAVRER
jgi:hypothetical protein